MRLRTFLLFVCFPALAAAKAHAPEDYPAIQQEASAVCWAAAAQNVLLQHGIHDSQATIVAKALVASESASGNPSWVSLARIRGHGVPAYGFEGAPTRSQLQSLLSDGYQIIALQEESSLNKSVVIEGSDEKDNLEILVPFHFRREIDSPDYVAKNLNWVATLVVSTDILPTDALNNGAFPSAVTRLFLAYGLSARRTGGALGEAELTRLLRKGYRIIVDVKPKGNDHAEVVQGLDSLDRAIVSDPWTGRNTAEKIETLERNYGWSDSIIIGPPIL